MLDTHTHAQATRLRSSLSALAPGVFYKVDDKPMFLAGCPPVSIKMICQLRRDSHKVPVRSADILPCMHRGKSYRAFSPSSPLRSPRQWSELPEGPLCLLLVLVDGVLRVRRPSAREFWVWMQLPSQSRDVACSLALPEMKLSALAAAAVAGYQGRAITSMTVDRALSTVAFMSSCWCPDVPFLHFTAPVMATPVVRVVLLLVALHPVPCVAVAADGSIPGVNLVHSAMEQS